MGKFPIKVTKMGVGVKNNVKTLSLQCIEPTTPSSNDKCLANRYLDDSDN